jgi:diaminopimelate decarboxylase
MGELFIALEAGCDPKDIVFAGAAKTDEELGFAITHGVTIVCEAMDELTALNEIADDMGSKSVRVFLRINPNVVVHKNHDIATGHALTKFGMPVAVARQVLANKERYPLLSIEGIQIHIGSQQERTGPLTKAIKKVAPLIREFKLKNFDIGGGLPVAYKQGDPCLSPAKFAKAVYRTLEANEIADVQLILEPGRYIVAESGVLLVEAQTVKKTGDVMTVTTNGGMSDLVRPAMYGAYHEILSVEESAGPFVVYNVAGPQCETDDMLGYDRLLPELRRYDLLVVADAGAYGYAMASNYCRSRRPREILVDGDKYWIVGDREDLEDLIAMSKRAASRYPDSIAA